MPDLAPTSGRPTDSARVERTPFGRFTYVDVTFTLANANTAVPHTLKVPDSNAVRYEVIRKDRACDVYEDFSPNRRTWKPNLIYLKCDTAGAQVRLRLFTERFSE
jgi:hypothetical protein